MCVQGKRNVCNYDVSQANLPHLYIFTHSFYQHSTTPYKNFTQPPLVVADMMAGVGPFAVPLSMPVNFGSTVADREIKVHANGKIARV